MAAALPPRLNNKTTLAGQVPKVRLRRTTISNDGSAPSDGGSSAVSKDMLELQNLKSGFQAANQEGKRISVRDMIKKSKGQKRGDKKEQKDQKDKTESGAKTKLAAKEKAWPALQEGKRPSTTGIIEKSEQKGKDKLPEQKDKQRLKKNEEESRHEAVEKANLGAESESEENAEEKVLHEAEEKVEFSAREKTKPMLQEGRRTSVRDMIKKREQKSENKLPLLSAEEKTRLGARGKAKLAVEAKARRETVRREAEAKAKLAAEEKARHTAEELELVKRQYKKMLADQAFHEEQLEVNGDQIKSLKELVHSLKQENKDMRAEMFMSKTAYGQQAKLDDLQEQINKWETLYFESAEIGASQIERLEKELEDMKQNEIENDMTAASANGGIGDSSAELRKTRGRIRALEQQLQQARGSEDDRHDQISGMRDQLVKAERTARSSEFELAETKKQINSLQTNIADLCEMSKFLYQGEELETKPQHSKESQQHNQNDNSNNPRTMLLELKGRLTQALDDNADTWQELNASKEEVTKLKNQLKENEKNDDKNYEEATIELLREQLEKAQQMNEASQHMLSASREEISILKKELEGKEESARANASDNEKEKETLTEFLREELAKAKKRNEVSQQELAASRHEIYGLNANGAKPSTNQKETKSETERLREQLTQAQQKSEYSERELAESRSEISKLYKFQGQLEQVQYEAERAYKENLAKAEERALEAEKKLVQAKEEMSLEKREVPETETPIPSERESTGDEQVDQENPETETNEPPSAQSKNSEKQPQAEYSVAKERITCLEDELDELAVQLLEAEAETATADETIQELTDQLEAAKQELIDQRENDQRVSEELTSSLKQHLNQSTETLASKEKEGMELEKENSDLRRSVEEYKLKAKELEGNSNDLKITKAELDNTKLRLRQVQLKLKEVGALNETIIDQAQKEIEKHKESVEELKQQLHTIEEENKKLREVKGSLQGIDKEMSQVIEDVQTQLPIAKEQNESLKKQLEEQVKKTKDALDEVASLTSKLNQMTLFESESAAKAKVIEGLENELDILHGSLEAYNSTIEAMEEDHRNLRLERDSLLDSSGIPGDEKLQNEIQKLCRERDSLKEMVKRDAWDTPELTLRRIRLFLREGE